MEHRHPLLPCQLLRARGNRECRTACDERQEFASLDAHSILPQSRTVAAKFIVQG
jgi:hypothetical protein